MGRIAITLYLWVAVAWAAVAQPRFTSNTETQHLGQIEWKHPVTVQFAVTNTGDQPLVLTEVEPDCACSMAQWTRTPIPPGAKGNVNVTFDAKALGHFQKSVAVYTNATPHPVYLHLTGEVVTEIKDFTRTHPFLIGQIRIDTDEIEFPDVHLGEHPVKHIGVVNLSDRPYEPVLMHLPPYIEMQVQPEVLQKGEKGIITLTLNPERLADLGLTQSSVYLSRFSGDKVTEESEIPISAVLLPDFSHLSENERRQAPVMQLSATTIDVSKQLIKKKRARQDLVLLNAGHSPLYISKLQVFHPAIGVNLKKSVLAPGESVRLRVDVNKKNIGKTRRQLRLLMITNDPEHPKVLIDIKAR